MKKNFLILTIVLLAGLMVSCSGKTAIASDTDEWTNSEEEVTQENEGQQSEDPASEAVEITAQEEEPQVTSESDKKAFASKFKKNVKAGAWNDAGWKDSENYGNCYVNVTNKNNVRIDGSDYYITFKYAYQFAPGMHEEKITQKGKDLSANGKQKFSYHYTDDCSPEKVTVHWNLTDDQIYDKYGN